MLFLAAFVQALAIFYGLLFVHAIITKCVRMVRVRTTH